MRAVQCNNKQVEVVDAPAPRGEGVRVRVAAAGICGSDLHLVASGAVGAGVTLGHEVAGFAPDGAAVAVEPLSPCGACAHCKSGAYNLCKRGPAMIHGIALNGGMAEEILVPPRALVPLPAGVAPENACLVEPLAVTVHGLRRAQFRAGESCAVVGGGTIGLCAAAALAAIARGAGSAVAPALFARHNSQREAGVQLGALIADSTNCDSTFDLVVEAVGSEGALAQAVQLCKPGGRVAIVGSYWNPAALPGFEMCMKEINLVPASLYARSAGARDMEIAARMLAETPALSAALITHRFPLEAAVEAFEVAGARGAGAIKVVLAP